MPRWGYESALARHRHNLWLEIQKFIEPKPHMLLLQNLGGRSWQKSIFIRYGAGAIQAPDLPYSSEKTAALPSKRRQDHRQIPGTHPGAQWTDGAGRSIGTKRRVRLFTNLGRSGAKPDPHKGTEVSSTRSCGASSCADRKISHLAYRPRRIHLAGPPSAVHRALTGNLYAADVSTTTR